MDKSINVSHLEVSSNRIKELVELGYYFIVINDMCKAVLNEEKKLV
jgi:hypothetical protein